MKTYFGPLSFNRRNLNALFGQDRPRRTHPKVVTATMAAETPLRRLQEADCRAEYTQEDREDDEYVERNYFDPIGQDLILQSPQLFRDRFFERSSLELRASRKRG